MRKRNGGNGRNAAVGTLHGLMVTIGESAAAVAVGGVIFLMGTMTPDLFAPSLLFVSALKSSPEDFFFLFLFFFPFC